MKYHLNPETGEPGQCGAQIACPFGGDEVHYPTPEDARIAFEHSMAGQVFDDPGQAALPGLQTPSKLQLPEGPMRDGEREGVKALITYLKAHKGLRPSPVKFELDNQPEWAYTFELKITDRSDNWRGEIIIEGDDQEDGEVWREEYPIGKNNMDFFGAEMMRRGFVKADDLVPLVSEAAYSHLRFQEDSTAARKQAEKFFDPDVTAPVRGRYEETATYVTPAKSLDRKARREREEAVAKFRNLILRTDWSSQSSVRDLGHELSLQRDAASAKNSPHMDNWANVVHSVITYLPREAQA